MQLAVINRCGQMSRKVRLFDSNLLRNADAENTSRSRMSRNVVFFEFQIDSNSFSVLINVLKTCCQSRIVPLFSSSETSNRSQRSKLSKFCKLKKYFLLVFSYLQDDLFKFDFLIDVFPVNSNSTERIIITPPPPYEDISKYTVVHGDKDIQCRF